MNISPNLQSSTACAPFTSLLLCAPQNQDELILSSSAPNFCHSHSKAKDSQPQTFTLEFVQSTLSHRNTFNFSSEEFNISSALHQPGVFCGNCWKVKCCQWAAALPAPTTFPSANTPLLLFKKKERFYQMLRKHFIKQNKTQQKTQYYYYYYY